MTAGDGGLVLSVGAGESAVSAVEGAEVPSGIVRAEGDGGPDVEAASVVAAVACGSAVVVCEYVATATVAVVLSAVLSAVMSAVLLAVLSVMLFAVLGPG